MCPQCGALQKERGSACELCGSSLDGFDELVSDESAVEDESVAVELDVPVAPVAPVAATPTAVGGFCTSCGSPFPEGARFCGTCGRRLVALTPGPAVDAAPSGAAPAAGEAPAETSADTPTEGLGRQVLIVIGAGVLLVVGLFFVTVASKRSNGGTGNPAETTELSFTPAPLAPEVESEVTRLREEVESATGANRRVAQTRLTDYLVSEGRFDLAGDVQEAIARESNAEVDWIRAGNLYYDWMERVDGQERVVYAKKAVATYQQALAINPDNLDVRTDMAVAFMYDPENQMEAIANTNSVLEVDSNHVQANFNKGIMLLRIGRYDDAVRQFQRVKTLVGDSGNPIYQRAESALEAVAQVRAS